MKIFFTNETKKLDRFTIENEPIKSIDLMERAASPLHSKSYPDGNATHRLSFLQVLEITEVMLLQFPEC